MDYPPKAHSRLDDEQVSQIVINHPFAHLFCHTSHGLRVTRVPFAFDFSDGKLSSVRAHINAVNPQACDLDGSEVLVAFSGPNTYVSPNWRSSKDRAATWDYQAVHVWGRARVRRDRAFFDRLINDLAQSAEAKHASLCPGENWSMEDAPPEYVSKLFPHVLSFEVFVDRVEAISKLHQDYSKLDRKTISGHLLQSDKQESQQIGLLMHSQTS